MPNLNLLDRFLVMMERQEVPVSICFNKIDLVDAAEQEKLRAIYEPAGYPVHFISTYEKSGLEEFSSVDHWENNGLSRTFGRWKIVDHELYPAGGTDGDGRYQ
ncbi:MAG: GTPase RsgA [Clostridium fessum]